MATINGTPGDDLLIGTRRADVIDGRGGGDRIILRGGDDLVRVGPNDNFTTISSSDGNARIDLSGGGSAGGQSYFEVDYRLSGGVEVRVGPLRAIVKKAAGESTDTIVGLGATAAPVLLGIVGSARDDVFRVRRKEGQLTEISLSAGDDLVVGGGGWVRVTWLNNAGGVEANVAHARNGLMTGTAVDWAGGVDRFRKISELRGTDHDDRFTGSAGADTFGVSRGDDVILGRGGVDLMRYDRTIVREVDVDLQKKRAEKTMDWFGEEVEFRDTLRQIENVRGSNGDDVIRGDARANLLDGHGGDDVLIGRGGADVLIAERGDNRIYGGPGGDRLAAGGGDDALYGGGGDDVLIVAGGTNRLDGGAGDDRLAGGSGDDVLIGGRGDDLLFAGGGDNRLDGGPGRDRLAAGTGSDLLIGGAGADVFVFVAEGRHVIRDFGRGADRIDLSGIAGPGGFADIRDDIRQVGADAVIALGGAEIRLENVSAADLRAGDFLFG